MPKFQPLVQLCGGDGELLTQFIYSLAMGEVFSQYLKDKKEAIARVGNDKIRQNGIAQYEVYCKNEEEKRERSKAYFKERYRREQEKYRTTKEKAEQGDEQAIELLAEYDRRIAHKKKQASDREKAKRRARKNAS